LGQLWGLIPQLNIFYPAIQQPTCGSTPEVVLTHMLIVIDFLMAKNLTTLQEKSANGPR